MDTRGSPHIRGKGKKNVKHLECGGNTKEHLEKRRFDSSALTVQTGTPTTRTGNEDGLFLVQKKGVQATDEAQGAETKSWGGPGRGRELQQEAT